MTKQADSSPLNTHKATSRWVYCHSSSIGFDSKTAVRIRAFIKTSLVSLSKVASVHPLHVPPL
ncbi:hypothetical protein T4D_6223 [Trichinella pseudospiralis]|uniref:Uncharacterized protein n=1 Tax=Trichinella pseudospiralis TaxID=6337 RepID=A0A0V1FX10_TRIPS|nr:hypothetical protein T4D_6223 [Trichinella pseudospiralis]